MKNQLIFLLELSLHASLFAGNENFPAGARSSSLATASVSLPDLWSSFNNQAGLAWLRQPSAAFYSENKFLVRSYALQAATVAVPLMPGTLCLNYRSFGYSEFYESKTGLAFARKLLPTVAAGVQLNYHQTYIAEGYGTSRALTVELGLLYSPSENLFIGFHAFNPNRSRSGSLPAERIPTVMRIGAGYHILGKAVLLFETEKDIDNPPVMKGGIEVHALKNLDFRFGCSSGYIDYTFGMGYSLHRWNFDLAFTRHRILGFSPDVSIAFKLGQHHE
jgi:hypothetical protein